LVSETLTGIVLVATESENAHRPSYFAFGCVRTAVQRKVFYGVLVNTMGRWGGHSEQDVDRGDKNARNWSGGYAHWASFARSMSKLGMLHMARQSSSVKSWRNPTTSA
jgi:hypothetical protein